MTLVKSLEPVGAPYVVSPIAIGGTLSVTVWVSCCCDPLDLVELL